MTHLKIETTGLLYAVNLLRGTTGTNPTELKDFIGTWNLTVRKIQVVGKSPRMGLIDISAEPVAKTATFLENTLVSSITFLDKEFAEFTFSNGEKGVIMSFLISVKPNLITLTSRE